MRTVPGADQPGPTLLRQEIYPLPYFPPTTNAAVLRSGTITTQWACSSISCGIPLSGAAITSENKAAASSNRFADSLSLPIIGVIAIAAARKNFIGSPFSGRGLLSRRNWRRTATADRSALKVLALPALNAQK